MAGHGRGGVGTRRWAALLAGLVAVAVSQAALAADCPGHPDALGTSRTLVVDPREHRLVGTMQYRETLPLEDGEVVLTFDDGPLPKYSNQILDILAAQCVKATFFLVGRQAQANPEGVRKVREAGHTVATHTQSHPSNMHRLPIERARREIDDGIASVTAALGDQGAAVSPFFRIPGLARNDDIEDYAASKGLQIWSADFPADDWRHVSSARVYDLAMQRLAAKGKGILLLHDIQPRTVAALPGILRELKRRGYRIVHVVPASPELPATATDPSQWQLHPPSENVAAGRWPRLPNFVFTATDSLPAPQVTDSWWNDGGILAQSFERSRRGHAVPLPREAPWPRQVQIALATSTAKPLAVPAPDVFEVAEGVRTAMQGFASAARRAEPAVAAQAEAAEAQRPAKPTRAATRHSHRMAAAAVRGKRAAAFRPAQQARAVAHGGKTAAKPVASDKKNVRRPGRHQEAQARPGTG
ncbi:MAG TPA: polysaccharide deacetylase family protein [Bradyrhizobium sp.]|nr:polysaccharide deacetylase family protein [Bradyrhizobium sp.]